MSRRRVVEDPVSHERWLVSYADFVTLLFAFFVVMYSISQINEGKYRILSSTLTEAFNQPELTLDPFQVGEVSKSNPINLIELNKMAIEEKQKGKEEEGSGTKENNDGGMPNEFKEISDKIEQGFGELLKEKLITVRGNEEWLEVELKSSLLFASGEAQLSVAALELLGDIADILRTDDNPIRVEGFTDSVPINTRLFPSNWQLSTARAAAVVQLFIEEGLSPERLAAIGYGEFQPTADNRTAEGRAANRRVVLMISKTGQLRPELPDLESSAPDTLDTEQLIEVAPLLSPIINKDLLAPDTADDTAKPVTSEQLREEGVQTIELEGGGLLFTSDPVRARQ